MSSPLIDSYVSGLHRRLPRRDRRRGRRRPSRKLRASPRRRGRRQASRARRAGGVRGPGYRRGRVHSPGPGRRAARLLLATGPVAAGCWAAALVASRAWDWPVPGAARLAFAAALLLAVLALLVAAATRRSYQRTRLAVIASPVIIALDASAIACVLAAAPTLSDPLVIAIAVSLTRIVFTTRVLRRLAAR